MTCDESVKRVADLVRKVNTLDAQLHQTHGLLDTTQGSLLVVCEENDRLRAALATIATPDAEQPGEVRTEWAAWEDTDIADPNDEAARVRPFIDRADAEVFVARPNARRRRIARRTVTTSRWIPAP